jgi:hypothetical protein
MSDSDYLWSEMNDRSCPNIWFYDYILSLIMVFCMKNGSIWKTLLVKFFALCYYWSTGMLFTNSQKYYYI